MIRSILLLVAILTANAIQAQQVAPLPIPAPPGLAAKSYLVIDYHTGKIIAEKNPDEKLEPASLTKMMTAYIVSFQLTHSDLSPDDLVPIRFLAKRYMSNR